MRRRRLALIAFAVALALAAAVPSASFAATSARSATAVTKYVALDGSGSHLLYAAKTTSKRFTGADGTRYILDAKGHRTTVPKGWTAYLVGDDPLLRRQTTAVDGPVDVHWRRPEHRTSGVLTVPEASTLIAPAPDGWIIETQVGGTDEKPVYQLRRVFTDGSKVDLGIPYPDGAPFTPQATPSGLLVISEVGDGGERVSDGTIRFMRWAAPGTYRTLYPAAGTTAVRGTAFSCGNASAKLALCNIEGDETVNRLLSLDGSAAPIATYSCSAPLYWFGEPAVRTFGIAWIGGRSGGGCHPGRVEQVTTSGTRTVSTRRYSTTRQPVTAFGRLVLGTASQRHLVSISGPTGTPKQIVGR